MRVVKKLPSMTNVTANSKATLNCPVGNTYEKIMFEYSGTTFDRTHMSNISVLLNGKEIQRFTDMTEVDFLNDFYGRSDTAGFITLYFNRPEMDNLGMRRVTGLGTSDVQSLTIEMDISASAVAPVLSAHAILREPEPLGLITKIKRFPVTFATSGKQDIDNLPLGARIAAIHLKKPDVSAVEVEIDSVKVYDVSKAIGEALQKENGRIPQTATATHIDFMLDNDMAQALVTNYSGKNVQDLRIRPTIDSSGQITALVEYLDDWGGM